MNIQTSTIDNEYKLATYSNGVQYVIYNSASWLVGDKIGDSLKAKFFKEPTLEQRIKQWFSREGSFSTSGRTSWSVKTLASELGISVHKIYSVLRKADWCDAEEGYTSTRYGDYKKYYFYRYNGAV
jgi:hypothetical protein